MIQHLRLSLFLLPLLCNHLHYEDLLDLGLELPNDWQEGNAIAEGQVARRVEGMDG